MRKRILSIVLVLALCLAYMPVQVLAADLEIATVDISGNLPSFCSSPYEVTYGQTITFDLHAADPSEGYTISERILDNGTNEVVFDTATDGNSWTIDKAAGYYRYQIVATVNDPTDSFAVSITPAINGTPYETSFMAGNVAGEVVTPGSSFTSVAYSSSFEVMVDGRNKTVTYNGEEQTGVDYELSFGPADVPLTADDIAFSGPGAKGTNVGTYSAGLDVPQFTNTNQNVTGTMTVYIVGDSNLVIEPVSGNIVAKPTNKTISTTDALPTNSYTVTGLVGDDELEGTPVYSYETTGGAAVADPREEGAGTYRILLSGLSIPAAIAGNYAATSVTFETGTLTVEEPETSYDFEQPSSGVGAGKAGKNSWTWGERANLPVEVADFYKVLVENSVPAGEATPAIPGGKSGHSISNFLAKDNTWGLPATDPAGPTYKVDEALVCEDHEPDYYANGDGKVDQETFGKSDFYVVGVGTGDTKIDYPKLTTGDVVSNTKFNGVYITKLQKSGNATYDADLAKLKSDCIASFRAFELDHPEVFWLTGSVKLRVLTVTISGVQTSYIFMTLVDDGGFTMRISEYATAGAIEKAITQRDTAVNAILAQIPADATVRQKISNLNKWFTLHNEYNRSTDLNSIGFTPHRALKSLVGNEGANGPVCDGYSRGFKVICDKLGIPVVLDTGMASIGNHSELHMWMRVQVDGAWYGMDCTWDDPIVSGKNGKISGYENEKYMLVGDDTVVDGKKFSVSHPSNKTAGGTTGVLFAGLTVNPKEIDDYLVLPFTDVRLADWFFDYVKAANSKNIVGGMTPTTYGPAGQLTHAQIMVMVANLHSRQKGDNFKSSPVPGDHWAAAFRNYLKKEGVIDDRFDAVLDKPVTRGEMSYYFANALTKSSYKNKQTISLSDITDNPYKAEIERLAKANIVGGFPDGTFRAGELVTRSQASVFVTNILDAIGK